MKQASSSYRPKSITHRVLLEHMQHGQAMLLKEIHQVRTDLRSRIDRLEGRMGTLEGSVRELKNTVDDVKAEVYMTRVQNLPKRVRRLEKAVFAQA